ncbi:MAG: permease-like cell division protein FtsX [Dehalobacterium sp.]
MKCLYNAGYFLKEIKTMIRLNLLSHIFSFFSTGLIFFLLALVISGWWISNQVIEAVQGEAEIDVYFDESLDNTGATRLVEMIGELEGVREARIVSESEALRRMEDILGKEARVLEYFDDNPFSAFIEVKIYLEEIDPVLAKLNRMTGIEHIRDNREVLERLRSIGAVLRILGYLVIVGTGISTLVIISHIIRLGIYNHREQINTLRLLGAPETFIAFPFLLDGLLVTLSGGILAAVLGVFSLREFYLQMAGPLPFLPLPPRESLQMSLIMLIPSLGIGLGLVGSLFGLLSAREN